VERTLERLDVALTQLTDSFPRAAQVVQLRFIVGLSTEETARHLGLSSGTVKREWTFARAWLNAAIAPQPANHA
jgi:RNA polymerase sigma factor (sigma-70 family)